MYLVDYHTHSSYSFDGKETIENMCEMAISRGLSELAITDHMDIYSDKNYDYILDCEKLYKELKTAKEEYAGRLKVIIGAEYGQPQVNKGAAYCFIQDYPLDFIIGSVHNLWGDRDVCDYNFKETDYHSIYNTYVDWLYELASNYEYDVLGHINYPTRYIHSQTGITVDMKQYAEQYEAILKKVIERGKGIELNVSGIARNSGDIMPDMYLLKMYRSLGGEIITVGSDAHILNQIGIATKQGYEVLKKAGFRYITTYEDRKPGFILIE